ncbi:MAG: glycosyltransferase family 4 protein, partial [Pseudomonadota bacterium]
HSVLNFRGKLIEALQAAGHEVVVLAPFDTTYTERLRAMGCICIDIPMQMTVSPLRDIRTFFAFRAALRQAKVGAYLGYTVKPNTFGALAAHSLGIPVISNISGLGTAFISRGLLTVVAKRLYRLALARAALVFFQNTDDRDLFLAEKIVTHDRYDTLPGSGVDLQRFVAQPLPPDAADRQFRFLMVSRLLWDKGVGELVGAAKSLRAKGRAYEFRILGQVNVMNPAAISEAELQDWIDADLIVHRGFSDDVRAEIAAADCVVLPSYREGTPRSLLEAAAMGRPIVTTDAVGCRNTVDDGVTGLLCRLKDAEDLADKLDQIAQMPIEARQEMGRAARAKMEREFDETIIIDKYLGAIARLAGARAGTAGRTPKT